MCRHAAYIGPPITLARFLVDPPHSLGVQSWKPREQISATVNADGYGVGWYLDDGTPGVYVNPLPIWSDVNLAHLARVLMSGVWVGNVRSATPGLGFGTANAHPFCADGCLSSHNGFIDRFAQTLRATIRAVLPPHIEASLNGNTDSEHLFAYLRHLARMTDDLGKALHRLAKDLERWAAEADVAVLLNLIVADGTRVYATRTAVAHASPSLYVCVEDPAFPEGTLVASEPLTETGAWEKVPDHHLVILERGKAPRLEAL